jgi:hypothetical protein
MIAGSIPSVVIRFFNLPNPCRRTMALGSAQPLAEKSTRTLPGVDGWPTHKADDLTAICELFDWKMGEPRRLTILWSPWLVTGIAYYLCDGTIT